MNKTKTFKTTEYGRDAYVDTITQEITEYIEKTLMNISGNENGFIRNEDVTIIINIFEND